MQGRQAGSGSALIVTQQPDLATELTRAVEGLGFAASVISALDHIEAHADARPALVLTDIALRPTLEQWTSLAQLFPRSALWAVADPTDSNIRDVAYALKAGCHDCLSLPVTSEQLGKKLEGIGRPLGVKPGELDRYMSNEINLELPSDLSIIEHVVRLLAGCCRDYRSYGPRKLVSLRIALSEALSNAIQYGNRGDRSKLVRLRASVNAWTCRVQVTDEGPGFDHSRLPDPTSTEAIESSGGRGLFLLTQLADDVAFNETGNSVTVTLNSDWEAAVVGESIRPVSSDAEALIGLVERVRLGTDADIHLWAENLDGSLEHIAPEDQALAQPDGTLHWLRTPGIRYAVQVWPANEECSERWAEFTRDLLDEALTYEMRLAESRRELAERQEEIELLHSITETLGAVDRLEDATSQILKGVLRVTGAERASLWVYEPDTESLVLAASEGPSRRPANRVSISSPFSVSALAFRENRTVRLDELDALPPELAARFGERPEPWVAVPVTYTSPDGSSRPVGVLNLIGRRSGALVSGFGEARLLMTLARQIGNSLENLRLLEEILSRERVIGELELAYELQMKLLPDLRLFDEVADVAARCVPARPVGGDFYQLFKLSDGKIGAMLGDVTSHGFGASLIMALSMSVMGIYARETTSPGELLRAIHGALIQKLESTEMFMTVFYGVIDPARRMMTYANAGHAHSFRIHGDEPPQRLRATSPPLGIADFGGYDEASIPWEPGDLLCLFTDGLTNPTLRTNERAVLEAIEAHRALSAPRIVDAIFEARQEQGGEAPDDQTAFVLRLERSR
ncbi:MAG: SpoIIE family protein phosphatase [Gemmatimonadota bacterium]|nr:MAG: SpoIIE family protein phosphatase [Gemmatimonadota bacterium]